MQETDLNWEILDRLRKRFLDATPEKGAYWQSDEELAQYHATFAARIGWKWDNALENAAQTGFQPKATRVLDWGCGSGIATLRFLAFQPSTRIEEIVLWDHSLMACRFAQKMIQETYPNFKVTIASNPDELDLSDTIVLVSHAMTELGPDAQSALTNLIRKAAAAFIVEPGDHAASHKLIALREALRDSFQIVAPCTRCESCPMLEEGNTHHWCHFFGKPPIEAFTEGFWAHFAQGLEIDLRSLPYSYLALSKDETPSLARDASRLVGRPRQYKGYTRILSCDSVGLRELELQKRDDKQLWKYLKKGPATSLFKWQEIDDPTGRLKAGEPL